MDMVKHELILTLSGHQYESIYLYEKYEYMGLF